MHEFVHIRLSTQVTDPDMKNSSFLYNFYIAGIRNESCLQQGETDKDDAF